MEDYYDHKCKNMDIDESIRNYAYGWEYFTCGKKIDMNFIYYCPTCGVDLEKECMTELARKYPDTYGRLVNK